MKTFDTYRNGLRNLALVPFLILYLNVSALLCAQKRNGTETRATVCRAIHSGMARKLKTQTSTTSPVVPATPNYTFATEMPVSPLGRALYSSGNAADVFMSMLPGTTAKSLKSTATDHTKHYVLGRHMTRDGRNGLRFSLLVNGKLHDGPIDIDRLDDNATVRVCNVRPAINATGETVIVNSAFKRGSTVTLAEIMSARAAKQTADAGTVPLESVPAALLPAVVDAAIAATAKPAKRKSAAK